MRWVKGEVGERLDRALWVGNGLEEFLREVREYARSREPSSGLAQLDDFLDSVVWKDFCRELQVWMEDLHSAIISGESKHSEEYLRGCIAAINRVLALPDCLRDQVEVMEAESVQQSNNS